MVWMIKGSVYASMTSQLSDLLRYPHWIITPQGHKNTGKRYRLRHMRIKITMTWEQVQSSERPDPLPPMNHACSKSLLFIEWWIAAYDKLKMCCSWYNHLLTTVPAEWALFVHALIWAHGVASVLVYPKVSLRSGCLRFMFCKQSYRMGAPL
jgi:hypothetical protein